MRGCAQAAGGVVGPAVIAAAQDVAAAGAVLQDGRAPVAADVVEGAQFAVAFADGEEAPAGELDGDVVAGRCQLIEAAEPDPLAAEDCLALALVDLRRVIPSRGKGEGKRWRSGQVHGVLILGSAEL